MTADRPNFVTALIKTGVATSRSARPRSTGGPNPRQGKLGHAELKLGGRRLFLADEWLEGGVLAPKEGAGTPMSLVLDVDDVDAAFARAVDLGARVERPVTEAHGDRGGWLFDPSGHRWFITTSGRELSRDELQEQVGTAYEIT